ncbi:MAG: hypothetical protein ACJAZ2_002019 [Glaciecola sp.]|jgi:uncharacterized protein (DUF2141 family)
MIKKVFLSILIFGVLVTSVSFVQVETFTITVNIKGFKNKQGQIDLALYNNKNQYTDNPWKDFHVQKSTSKNGIITFILKDIVKGKYAITFLDDENSNKEMDYSFLGLPEEGFGFSNNVKPGFLSAPKYEKCTFDIYTDKELTLNVQYW